MQPIVHNTLLILDKHVLHNARHVYTLQGDLKSYDASDKIWVIVERTTWFYSIIVNGHNLGIRLEDCTGCYVKEKHWLVTGKYMDTGKYVIICDGQIYGGYAYIAPYSTSLAPNGRFICIASDVAESVRDVVNIDGQEYFFYNELKGRNITYNNGIFEITCKRYKWLGRNLTGGDDWLIQDIYMVSKRRKQLHVYVDGKRRDLNDFT
jgi:hypothetical protein